MMKKTACVVGLLVFGGVGMAMAQAPPSPPAKASVAVAGKTISISYSAPSVRGRDIFGPTGRISQDPTYPIWRAGANSATALHTDADLVIGTLAVPRGDYTLFINLKDPNAWELIVNRQTGQWGLTYNQGQDVGRVRMTMSKPSAPVEQLKYTLTATGGNSGTLRLEWENRAATVPFTVK
jgi:hypothetical protein